MAIAGIDIGGTNFRIGLVEADGSVGRLTKTPVEQVFSTREPLADLSAFLTGFFRGEQVEAVAIGFPATLDRARRTVLQAPNVPFMENLPVVEALEKALGIPVFIERDVTFALLSDCRSLGIPARGMVCGIYFGTGIGNAIAIDGRPLVGRHGTAGELGHIPADGSDTLCGCGNTGCLEPLAGGRRLKELCRTRYPETPVEEIFLRHGGDAPLLQVIDRMAMAVATEINILDPDVLLIGGGVPNLPGFPREELTRRILARTRKPLPAEELCLRYTGDSPEKCVLGAALYAKEKLQNRL